MPVSLRHSIGIDWGTVALKNGKHEIFIDTIMPVFIWLDIEGNGGQGCGQDPVDEVAWSVAEHGFILFADIKSDSAVISWFASRHPCGGR